MPAAFTKAEKEAARQATHAAVRAGQLARPHVCDRCSAQDALDAHHRNYADPLDIEWLCGKCHVEEHKPKHVRHQRTRQVLALKREGLNGLQIADRLGLGKSYVYELIAEGEGRGGRPPSECEACGDRVGKTSRRWCRRCYRLGRVRETWPSHRIVAALQQCAEVTGRRPGAADFNPTMARQKGWPERARRYEEYGWPSTSTIQERFGSWNAAMLAAGFRVYDPKRDFDWSSTKPKYKTAA